MCGVMLRGLEIYRRRDERRNMKKYEDLYVIKGKITVDVANKKGKTAGTTELLLTNVWIKVPRQNETKTN